MVLRGGKKLPLPVNQVVVGDIVDVKFGDRAPADLRIIRSAGLKVRGYELYAPRFPIPSVVGSCLKLNFQQGKIWWGG